MRYSPHPPELYTWPSEGGRVGVGREFNEGDRLAAWNLFWLSEPAVDRFLAAPGEPVPIDTKMFQACFQATQQDLGGELLQTLLVTRTAQDLVCLIKARRHKHLAPFELRGEQWLKTIFSRAEQGWPALDVTGNVVHVDFGARIRNSTSS